MDFEEPHFHYWDVFPKTVKVSLTGWSVKALAVRASRKRRFWASGERARRSVIQS